MIPIQDERRSRRIEGSVVSKAADKSRKVRQKTHRRLIALMIWSIGHVQIKDEKRERAELYFF